MAETMNGTIIEVTENYKQRIDLANPPSPCEVEEKLLFETQRKFELANTYLPEKGKWKIPQTLFPYQIEKMMLHLHPICRIAAAGMAQDPAYDLLSIYVEDGEDAGTYVTDDYVLEKLILQYNATLDEKGIRQVMNHLRRFAPRKEPTHNPDLVAVNNGIFDFKRKILLPFSPDYIFTCKSHVDYNPNAQNVTIHNPDDNTDWDVESWMNELSDNVEIVDLLWKIIGAVLRPNVSWNKSAWFYSEKGNNGKGTLCALMRNILGQHAYATISLSDFSKDFMLESLVKASAIIVDENDVGVFVDKAANLKAVITGDIIQVNRKFKSAISYKFRGFMVQCLNEMPKVKDKSDSFYRRQLFVPFEKTFTGHERKYIKDDYLARKEVLEYVMFKVLNMDYYELPEPEACKQVLQEYKEFNDPAREFLNEFLDRFRWDLLPVAFLHELYVTWCRMAGHTQPMARNALMQRFRNIIGDFPGWAVTSSGNNGGMYRGTKMDAAEPLIMEYNLVNWKHPDTSYRDRYRGLYRISGGANGGNLNDDDNAA